MSEYLEHWSADTLARELWLARKKLADSIDGRRGDIIARSGWVRILETEQARRDALSPTEAHNGD